MSLPIAIDPRTQLVDALRENPERFQVSNLIFKNSKGVNAVFEIGKLAAELLDFAKNPKIGMNLLGPKPNPPDMTNLTKEQQQEEVATYKELLEMYDLEKKALSMQISLADMLVIQQFLKPFEDALHATPAVKGKRFHAFTKQVDEQQEGIFASIAKKQRQNSV